MHDQPELTIYGTRTSPYVRRVRAMARLLELDFKLVDTRDPRGQAGLRARNPLWRVPTIEIEGSYVFDSRVIVQDLIRRFGRSRIEPIDARRTKDLNCLTVIDGVLDTLINVFYLMRDGVSAAEGSYLAKQQKRARACMQWLDERVQDEVWITSQRKFGIAEINLVSALDWMRFRGTYPVHEHPALTRCLAEHEQRPCMWATRPPYT